MLDEGTWRVTNESEGIEGLKAMAEKRSADELTQRKEKKMGRKVGRRKGGREGGRGIWMKSNE